MESALRALSLILLGVSVTWLLTVVLGRYVSRRGFAFWVWDRSGSIGRVLIALGFGLVVVGLGQGNANSGSSLMLLGALLGMAGIWLILPGP